MLAEYLNDLHYIWPEVVMTVAILLALFSDLILGGRDQKVTGIIALLCTGLVIYFLFRLHAEGGAHQVFGIVVVDQFAILFKILAAIGLLVVLFYAVFFREFDRDGIGEFYAVILSSTLGIFFLVSTNNLLLLYLALEMLSITSYVLAGFLKKERRSGEAALKYLVYGALSSGVMLFGFSILFGLAGTLHLPTMGEFVAANMEGDFGGAIMVSLVLILMGFCFKIAAFPFHFWCPDVYEGAPTPVTTFLAVCSKAAGFGLVLRFMNDVFVANSMPATEWGGEVALLIGMLSAVTMTYGNLTAVKQQNVKRMLAYSSIAHAGYLLMGVAAMFASMKTGGKADAVIFYLIAYLIMNLGAFGVVIYLSNRYGRETVDDYRGLGWRAPYCCGFMVIFLLALTGLPPTVGFIGKWKLFVAVIDSGMIWLAVVAGLNAAVALFYYFRIAKALFFKDPAAEGIERQGSSVQGLFVVVLCVLGLAVLYYGVYWNSLEVAAKAALP